MADFLGTIANTVGGVGTHIPGISNLGNAIGGALGGSSGSNGNFTQPSTASGAAYANDPYVRPAAASSGYTVPDYAGQLAAYSKQLAALSAQQYQNDFVPSYNLNANIAKARTAAAGAVNPLYVKKLNDYLAQEKTNQERKQADVATANQQLQEQLSNTLQGSGIDRARTAEDTQTNLSGIANQAQNYQADTGAQFAKDRITQAGNVANEGLTTSGIGAAAQGEAQAARNTTEGRQSQAFRDQATAANLAKTRTFEDLARSDTLAQQKTTEGTAANTLDLNRYLQDLGTEEQQQRQSLEASRLSDISAEQQRQSQIGILNFANTLSGRNKINFLKAYGNLF